ncbi:zinc ribbon domain-containing protein [Erwinia sp. BNK-24-b]|uniref:zinc ribbon domain-containing protein n=1 Tax=Erwinia TaxID=551 RepID=UPI001FEE5AE3|nr:zinc ribbon domain-containing protein [Erwinia phyllosphaerae]MBV4367969.1 zinc ribbon domain-containing protein [Erwinia phyllosphaerae]
MSEHCPVCQHHLIARGERFYCASCQRDFAAKAICPDCGQSLQILKACGAVDYFCPNGDGLISGRRVVFKPLSESL